MSNTNLITKKRIINQDTLLKQQIVEHIKKAVLASKIILDEDCNTLLDTPLIFLPHVIKNYRPFVAATVSFVSILTIAKYYSLKPTKLTFFALLPVGCELIKCGIYQCIKYTSLRQIDAFIESLEHLAVLNRKVIKHLNNRINSLLELQKKVKIVEMIQVDDQKFALNVMKSLENVCRTLQEQLLIQAGYSYSFYSYIGNWNMESCAENATIEEMTQFIEKLSEFYILLASNLMSSSIFALEAAMWRSDWDFHQVFNTIKDSTCQVKQSVRQIDVELKQVYFEIHKTLNKRLKSPNCLPNTKNQSVLIYNESLDDFKNRLKVVFDLAKNIEVQKSNTRCIFLEEMLENVEASSVLIKNLLRYEKSLNKPQNTLEDVEKVKIVDDKHKNAIVNHREAEIGSDDEEFEYSPHESDDETERKYLTNDADFDYNAKKSVAVQSLMLQELRNRMKDVRRIKISRTANGDLIVQERPLTLQESGGQNQQVSSKKTEIKDENLLESSLPAIFIVDNQEVTPPAPPPPPIFTLPAVKTNSAEEIENMQVMQPPVNNTLLASISAIAKQRSQNEDVFGCDGEEYVASDEFSSEEE